MSKVTPAVHTCKNCGTIFSGHYCNNCSQAATTSRITWHNLFDMLVHGILHVDRGLPFTIKEMLIRPGKTFKGYFAGKRVNYFNPFLFLLIVGGVHLFLFETFEFKLITKQVTIKSIDAFSHGLAHHFYLIPSLFFLILLTFTDIFLYKKNNLNLPELIVFNTFCIAEVGFIIILFIPVLYLQQLINQNFGVLIKIRPYIKFFLLAYIIFARIQFFSNTKNYIVVLKVLIQVFAIYFLYEVLIAKLAEFLQNFSK